MLQRIASLLRINPPLIADRGLLFASGATVPTDASDGYQHGCIFQHTDGAAGSSLYLNEGSVTSCDFNNVDAGTFDNGITVGAFASVVAGSGIAIAAGASSGIFYGDDNGAVFGDSIYNLRTRLLLTVDQAGGTARALGAQLKLAAGVDVTTGIYTANQGYLELVGTHVSQTGANLSCMSASLEIGTSLTIDIGGEACGVHVETTGAGTITNNGTCAGVLIDKAAGAASWPAGILIDGPSVVQGVRVGKFAGSAATTSAVVFATTQNVYSDGQLSTVEIHGASNAALTSAYAAHCLRARHVVNCTTADHETYGVMGQCVVKDTTLTHLHAGVMGTFEGHTSGVVVNGAYEYSTGAIIARCGGGASITATKDICGVIAFWNGAAADSGDMTAFAIGDQGTAGWVNGVGVTRCTNLFALPADGTAPVAAGNYEVHGGTKVRISVTVGGSQYYMLASTAPTTQS